LLSLSEGSPTGSWAYFYKDQVKIIRQMENVRGLTKQKPNVKPVNAMPGQSHAEYSTFYHRIVTALQTPGDSDKVQLDLQRVSKPAGYQWLDAG
jgi:hypothetical protein